MIARYSTEEMQTIWADENRFRIWLEIELLALEKMAERGDVPIEAAQIARQKAKFCTTRVLDIESQVKHDVIAFLTNVAESVGPPSRFIHRGMTSSDLLDTTLACQIKQSCALLSDELEKTSEKLLDLANLHRRTVCIGRSHGIHAEPTTFGLKMLSWYCELRRHHARLEDTVCQVAVGKISGAVGTFASVSPEIETHVMEKLGLEPETVSTQIVSRDRHARMFNFLAELASSIDRFAVEIRHLQRTEVREVEESFSKDQKGSSAMPHKRNPILSENLCGLARLMRGYALSAMENVALWHERDISHSSVERVVGPDAFNLMHFMLRRFHSLISGMVIYPEQMQRNLELTNGIYASGTLLVRLVDSGITREDAYKMVQQHALAAWEGGLSFPERVYADREIMKIVPAEELRKIFSIEHHLANVDFIFERAIKLWGKT